MVRSNCTHTLRGQAGKTYRAVQELYFGIADSPLKQSPDGTGIAKALPSHATSHTPTGHQAYILRARPLLGDAQVGPDAVQLLGAEIIKRNDLATRRSRAQNANGEGAGYASSDATPRRDATPKGKKQTDGAIPQQTLLRLHDQERNVQSPKTMQATSLLTARQGLTSNREARPGLKASRFRSMSSR